MISVRTPASGTVGSPKLRVGSRTIGLLRRQREEAVCGIAGGAELNLVQERHCRVCWHQSAVSAKDHDVQSGVQPRELLRLERKFATRRVRLEGCERVLDLKAVAEEADGRAHVLEVTCLARYSHR